MSNLHKINYHGSKRRVLHLTFYLRIGQILWRILLYCQTWCKQFQESWFHHCCPIARTSSSELSSASIKSSFSEVSSSVSVESVSLSWMGFAGFQLQMISKNEQKYVLTSQSFWKFMIINVILKFIHCLGGRGGGGVSELVDGWGCAILALEVVPKNLIFALKSYPKIYFTRFYACYFSKENYASLIYQVKMASSLWQVAKIN